MSTPSVRDITITTAPVGLLTVDASGDAPADGVPPKRTKVTAGLAVLACVACCTLPPALVAAGILTGAAGALAESVLLGVSGVLVVAAAGTWWLHRRRTATATACRIEGESGCGCGGGC